MADSEVAVCNIALAKIGSAWIEDLEDTTRNESVWCKQLYAQKRDWLLEKYKWRFATKRAELTQLAEEPDFEYDYKYQLPNDFLGVQTLYGTTSDYEIEGNELLCNDDEVYLIYTKQESDPTKFTAIFTECLALILGADLAPAVKEANTVMREKLLAEFNGMILDGLVVEANKGKKTATDTDTEWQER